MLRTRKYVVGHPIHQQLERCAGVPAGVARSPEARFSTLLAQIPDINGGRTQSEIANLCLAELEAFSAIGAFGAQVWLVDAETGKRIHNYIEAYDGVFILHGKGEPFRIGLDRKGCFVRRPSGEELFRSMKFEQIELGGNNFEFRDQSTAKRFTCRAGIRGNLSDTDNPYYPRTLAVEESSDHADEYRYIVEPLRVVFQASVQSGHPVSWL